MAEIREADVLNVLGKVHGPKGEGDIVSLGIMKNLVIDKGLVRFRLEMSGPSTPEQVQVRQNAEQAVRSVAGVEQVLISMASVSVQAQATTAGQAAGHDHSSHGHSHSAAPKGGVKAKRTIPVASGKGGVGKSTVSANLAVALSRLGYRVGLMDADVYGPSIPTLMGITDKPHQENGKLVPILAHGVKVMSMGFFLPKEDAVIWRGPMLHKMVDQFLSDVEWGELDYLIIDLPPGTGDVQLSLCQSISLTGAVIVSTPQDLAFSVADKATIMFAKLKTRVIGLVENMTGEIFGQGGAKAFAEKKGIPFLGEIPLSADIRIQTDAGLPIVITATESESAKSFFCIAEKLIEELESGAEDGFLPALPKTVEQDASGDFQIVWNDGAESIFTAFELRIASRSADNMDEMTGERLVPIEKIDKNVRVVKWDRVGNYAIRFVFSDGHATGIYSFDYLREISKHQQGMQAGNHS